MDIDIKYLVIGAGPAGLVFANSILDRGNDDILVVEQDTTVGGLCKRLDKEGLNIDIGKHVLEVSDHSAFEYLCKFLPEHEWRIFDHKNKIDLNGEFVKSGLSNKDSLVDFPIETNLWQLDTSIAERYIRSIESSGRNLRREEPITFKEWVKWAVGEGIAEEYLIPYNHKIYGEYLELLEDRDCSVNVGLASIMRSYENKRSYNGFEFKTKICYPIRKPYEYVWNRMGDRLHNKGRLWVHSKANTIDIDKHEVKVWWNGREVVIRADIIVNTAPWKNIQLLTKDMTLYEEISNWKSLLKYIPIKLRKLDSDIDIDAQLIYCPSPDVEYYKAAILKNIQEPWTGVLLESNALDQTEHNDNEVVVRYGMPVNMIGYNKKIEQGICSLCERRIFGLGRWGEWKNYKSDVVIRKALDLSMLFE